MFSSCTFRRISWLLIVSLTFLPAVFAQSATATFSGTVTDEKGAVVTEAMVTLTNNATKQKRQARTGSDGVFNLSLLTPGKYELTVEHDGFTTARIPDIELNVNDQRTLQIQLKVGSVGETITIEAGSGLQETPAVGTAVNRQFVENLPLNGRSFQSLFELTPGIVLTPAGNGEPGQFSVNGQRTNSNYFTIDGVGANVGTLPGTSLGQSANGSVAGFAATGGTNNLVSVDALQEFKVQTSTFAPEFGRTPGAQVSIITRSGTNEFHGTAFEYFRNEKLDANDWFTNRAGLKRAPLRQNDFGGVFGGPLWLPKSVFGPMAYDGRNKTFFFFSYEGLRLRQPQSNTFFVPSPAMRQAAAPATRPLLNAFPLPNGPLDLVNGQPTGYATYFTSYSDSLSLDATSIRLDHNFGSRVNVFGRFNEAPSKGTDRLTNPSTPGTTTVDTRTLTLGSTQTFTPRLVNDLRFNYTRYKSILSLALDTLGGATPLDNSALFANAPVGARNPVFGFFLVELTPAFGFRFAPGLFVGPLYQSAQRQWNVVDNLSYQAGAHALKFGVDYRRLNPTFTESDYFVTYAAFTFSSLTTSNNIVNGKVNQIQIVSDAGERNPIFHNFSLYGQDTWKASKRLTLTYGLRWEVNPAPSERDGNNPLVLTNLQTPASIAAAPNGTALYETTYGNVAPRVGLSYQLRQHAGSETTLRGGFGIFYDLGGGGGVGSAFGQTFPFASRKALVDIFNGYNYPVTPAQAAPPPITRNLPATTEIYAFEPGLKLPRTYQWNVTLEQSLGRNQVFSAAYVAAIGRDLLRQDFLAAPNASFPSGVVVTRNTASSDYHALQLQFTRRMSRGLQALASYTWSKSLDTESSDVSRNASVLIVTPNGDRGPSGFDIRHSVSGALTWNVPAPGREPFLKALLGNWSADTIFRARSAAPVNIVVQNLNFNGVSNITRPNLVPGVPLYLDDANAPGGWRINPAAFTQPAAGTRGTLGRNALRGFNAWQLDFTARRDFRFTERASLQFRAEFFNIFNHPNFGAPENRFGNPLFGQATQMFGRSLRQSGSSTGAGFNSLFQIGGPRSVQLALKLVF